MKIKQFLSVCALALPLCAAAVPAWPGLHPVTLPDGSKINARVGGDEFFHYATDEQGFLLSKNAMGKLDYTLDLNGFKVKASPVVLEQMRAEAVAKLPSQMQFAAANAGVQRVLNLGKDARSTFPSTGDGHYLVILIEYSDLKWILSDPKKDMEERLNGENYNYMGSVGSMRQYYIDNSNGKFKPTFDIVGPVTLSKTNSYYVGDGKYDNVKECVLEACKLAHDQGVDFSKYDIDEDGAVDNVIIFYPGYGAADVPSQSTGLGDEICIWPHNSTISYMGESLDGKLLGNYCCFNELNGGSHYYAKDMAIDGNGTPVHEFAHVMGFPDLYDPNYNSKAITPGKWSIMDAGCYNDEGYKPVGHSSYERWVFRWTEMEDVQTGLNEIPALMSTGRAKRYEVYSNASSRSAEWFIFETRDNDKWDIGIPNQGMLIWHVDYSQSTFNNNRVNSTVGRPRCHLVTADGSANPKIGGSSVSTNIAAWPYNINYITPDTEINLWSNYMLKVGPVEHFITDIAFDDEKKVSSFNFDIITESPTLTTVLHTPGIVEGTKNKLHLEWDFVDGAESYQLTLYRVNSQGNKYYEQFLEEKNVGNVNFYELTIPSNKMNTEFHAYVRPVKMIPSINPSNEQVFKTSELEVVGIDEIAEEQIEVRGLKGAIEAPASAAVFNLAGAPCPREGLAPGIYLVKCADRTYKVVVR